jgi:DNA-binding HxlR family transcriptional regulator
MSNALQVSTSIDPRAREQCSIAKTLDVVSTRSAFLILREAFYGTTRFDQFARRVRLSPAVTAARLRELVEQGLLEYEDYREPGQRKRRGYGLTQKGADLFPVLAALMQWGDHWLANRGGPVKLRHHDCGEPVDVHLYCRAGHEVAVEDVEVAPNSR